MEYDNNEEFSKAKLPAYTETGAGTLGCILGAQTWTVLGSYEQRGGLGGSYWQPNSVLSTGSFAVPPHIEVNGRMSGVRNSKPFYDMGISFQIWPSDTLGGLHLLGADTSRSYTGRFVEQMQAIDFLSSSYADYHSSNRRPVRLVVRKLNRFNHTVSGTFAGTLYNGTGGHDSITVTDGRFDLSY
ncbi:hypothetical protein GCM10027594_15350 [Hymenobacter agri]